MEPDPDEEQHHELDGRPQWRLTCQGCNLWAAESDCSLALATAYTEHWLLMHADGEITVADVVGFEAD